MKFLFLVQGVDDPSGRYRLSQYMPYLRKRGFFVRLEEIPSSRSERAALFSSIGADEVVVLQKRLLSYWDLRRLVKRGRRLIYDIDDAVMCPDPFSGKRCSWTREARFRRTVRAAELVMVGNSYLKEKVEALGKRAIVIPTPVDTGIYFPAERGERVGIILGWLGSGSTLPYLERLLPALGELAASNPKVRLKVVCDRFPRSDSIDIENKQWSLEDEVGDLRSFDIGLMPLLDDPWSRGKCGLKLLQYMAVGIPAVASPVGVNGEIIADGANGFLALRKDEWIEKLNVLIADPDLRKAMGERARRTVEERYSLAVNAPLFVEAITE